MRVFLFSLLAIPLLVDAQGACIFLDLNTGDVYDLTPLNGTTFIAQSQTYSYVFTPCQNACQGPTIMASVCQVTQGSNSPIAPVSIFDNTMMWSLINPAQPSAGVMVTTQNGAPPLCPSGKPRAASIQFLCGPAPPSNAFVVVAEPFSSTCSTLPGYQFTLTTPWACPNATNPNCPYTISSPCTISTYNIYVGSKGVGTTIIFNESGDQCGRINFTPDGNGVDTCSGQDGATQLIANWDSSAVSTVEQLLQSGMEDDPIVFFWDPETQGALLGSSNGMTSSKLKFYGKSH